MAETRAVTWKVNDPRMIGVDLPVVFTPKFASEERDGATVLPLPVQSVLESGILSATTLLTTDGSWAWQVAVYAPGQRFEFEFPLPAGAGALDLTTVPMMPAWRSYETWRGELLNAVVRAKGDSFANPRRSGDDVLVDIVRVDPITGAESATTHAIRDMRGLPGTPGLPGTNGVATDSAVATNMQTVGTETQRAADGRFPRLSAITEGAAMQAVAADTSIRAAITGHSLPYGQDTTATGTTAPANGATQTRSSKPPTEAFRDQVKFTSSVPVVVVNQTYPGDQTADALTRWAAGESGDIEFFWLDTNDARNYGGRPRGPLTDGQTSTNLTALAQRARDRNASFVVIGGAPVLSRGDSYKIFASAQTDRAVAERYGATYVDVGELLSDYAANDEYWTDGVHWKPAAYSLIGARLAALLGPKGVNPPKAAPGRVFTWRDNVFVGGTNTTVDAPNVAGRVVRLLNTEALALSFDATVPVIPVVRFRASAHAAVGLYSNLNTNRVPVYATVGSSAVLAGISVVQAPPVTSPGPAGLVIRAESGTIDVLSVEFIPATSTSAETLGPLGGKQLRASDSWDSATAWRAARPTRSGIAQSAVKPVSFLFDVTLGHSDSGVLLAEAIHETMPYLARDGYLLLRRGATLLVRRMNDGTATTLATIADLFPTTGIVTTSIELSLTSAGAGLVTVAGTQVYTVETMGISYGIPGLVAGPTTGNAFASGRVSSR